MYCRKCGAELNDDATFCTMCGNTMVKNESSDNRDMHGTKKGKRKTIVIAIAAVALIMLVAAVGIFVFMSGKSDKPVVESFEGELTEEKARQIYLKCMEYMASDEYDYRNHGYYVEPNVLQMILDISSDKERKDSWEEGKEEGLVTGEYSEDKYVEYFLDSIFMGLSDEENIDYKEGVNKCIDIIKEADIEIEDVPSKDFATLKQQIAEKINKIMDGITYDTSDWEEAKYVNITRYQNGIKETTALMVLIDGKWKIFSPILQEICGFDVKPDDKMKRTDDANADTIESVINFQLQVLCSDDEITSYANPKTYKTVDEILNNYNDNNSDRYTVFENLVFNNLPQKYMSGSRGDYSIVTKQSGYTMYVLITGTLEEGYDAKVECAKTDPFIDER